MIKAAALLLFAALTTFAQGGYGPGPGLGQSVPPVPISYVGQCGAASTSCTPPTHAVGDLFIAGAGRNSSATAPTLPAGWTSVTTASINGSSSNDSALLVACKVATTTSETATGFTNAGWLVVHVYRNQAPGSTATCASDILGTPQNFTSTVNTTTTTVTYQSVTNANVNSWNIGIGFAPAATAGMGTAPTGMTNRSTGNSGIAGHDTNGGVASFTTANITTTTASRVITSTIEIKD
jgi:hypothetical protein